MSNVGATAFQADAFQTNPLAWQISTVAPTPNAPGGAIIYAVTEPLANRPEIKAATNFIPQVSVRDPNPTIFVYVGENLTASRSITLQMTKPDGTQFSETSNVFAGTGNPSTPAGVWPGFYAVYVFGDDDIDQHGTWNAQIFWNDQNGAQHSSGVAVFVIYP